MGNGEVVMNIAVIIPCFNASQTLARAIDSVIFENFVEQVIVVDNGSLDNSRDVALSYGGKVTLIECGTGGASAARNEGVRYAQSEFVHFLDADDYVDQGFLDTMASVANAGIDMVVSGHRQITADGVLLRQVSYRAGFDAAQLLAEYLVNAVQTSGFLWRRSWIGPAWDESLSIYQDGELAIRMLLREPVFEIISEPTTWTYWVQNGNPDRISNSFSREKAISSLRALKQNEAGVVALSYPPATDGLARRYYALARRCYGQRWESEGDEALQRARLLGLKSHPGGIAHATLCLALGLSQKVRFIRMAHRFRHQLCDPAASTKHTPRNIVLTRGKGQSGKPNQL